MFVLVSYYKMSKLLEGLTESIKILQRDRITQFDLSPHSDPSRLSSSHFLVPVLPPLTSVNCCQSHYGWAGFCSPQKINSSYSCCVCPFDRWSQMEPVPADLAHEGGFSSGVPKMLDAILFLLTGCSVGSSKPNEKLDPPPGGRKTLGIMAKHPFQMIPKHFSA